MTTPELADADQKLGGTTQDFGRRFWAVWAPLAGSRAATASYGSGFIISRDEEEDKVGDENQR